MDHNIQEEIESEFSKLPWNPEQFHEQDAGMEAYGSKVQYSSGIYGSHWKLHKLKIQHKETLRIINRIQKLGENENYRRATVPGR
jgi:hypothetical protein